jgi:anthranilate phosphoribosyltransferase
MWRRFMSDPAALIEAIRKLADFLTLTQEESRAAMIVIMEGAATPAQVAGFITALRMKGETPEEIAGCALAMREKATKVSPGPSPYDVVDTCGTGGTMRNTFNISTAAALVVAGAGVKVAKHGNRAASSKCGSADVLEALGVKVDADVPVVERCLREANVGFLFARTFHAAMKYAVGPRRELGIRTVFNVLGPLTNPAWAKCQVLGVYDDRLVPVIANVLKMMGSKHSFVVRGEDGLDEISPTGSTRVAELTHGIVSEYVIQPEDFGMARCSLADLAVGSIAESADVIRSILAGKAGPARNAVLLNAAAALAASGAAADIRAGIPLAALSLDNGKAGRALDAMATISNQPA